MLHDNSNVCVFIPYTNFSKNSADKVKVICASLNTNKTMSEVNRTSFSLHFFSCTDSCPITLIASIANKVPNCQQLLL